MNILLGFSNVFHIFSFVLVAAAVIIFFIVLRLLFVNKESNAVKSKYLISSLSIIGLSAILFSLLDTYLKLIQAGHTFASSGTGDPRILFGGVIEFLYYVFFNLLLGVGILVVWSLVNAYWHHSHDITK